MKKQIIANVLCFICASIVFAETWVLKETETGIIYTTETGKICEIYSEEEISSESYLIIENTMDTVWALPGLTGIKSQVHVEADSYFHFIFFPETLSYNDIDLKSVMPAGLSFRYDTALFYDVTLKVDEYLPRVTGAYISPDGFLDQLFAVYTMPEMYLEGEALLKRLERLEKALMAISKKTLFTKASAVSDEVILAVISLYNQNSGISQNEVLTMLEERGIKATKKDVEAVFMVHLGIFE